MEAVQVGAPLVQVVVAPELLTSAVGQGTVAAAGKRGVPVLEVSADVFAGLSAKEGPQGLGALLRQVWTPLDALRLGDELAWVALTAVQDPGNLGTILRTSDAVHYLVAEDGVLAGHRADRGDDCIGLRRGRAQQRRADCQNGELHP